jgi:tRNA modification GTPase
VPLALFVFGKIVSEEEVVDEVLLSIFKNPKSYTGEDSVEISCHGSQYIQQEILSILLNKGCELAKPGEFTQRAYLNGKMDLSQSEAVADLIAAENKAAHNLAMRQMKGSVSKEINTLREHLLNFASLIELELDFSEEDVEFADRTALNDLLNKTLATVNSLIQSFYFCKAKKKG